MAWTCSGSTNAELVANLAKHSILKTPRVIQAFNQTDRTYYVPNKPYEDAPQRIGFGATISAPHMHAHAVETLEPFLQPGAHVLDIGSGSGYLLSIFHKLVSTPSPSGPGGGNDNSSNNNHNAGGGTVLGIDHLSSLVDLGSKNLSSDPTTRPHLGRGGPVPTRSPSSSSPQETASTPSIFNILGDGRLGAPPEYLPPPASVVGGGEGGGGFEAIHVGAACRDFPQVLIDQLCRRGRMFVPVGEDWGEQHVWQIDKDQEGKVEKKKLFGVRYIPLTDPEKQYVE